MDETLCSEREAYVAFVRRVATCRTMEFVIEPGTEEVGFFGVAKKNGKVRLATDYRRSNARFSKPRHAEMATVSAFSQLAVEPGQQYYVAHFDIENAVYSFELPEQLCTYFCCPRVQAGAPGLRELGGVALHRGDFVTPRLKVLPMGWSRALW